MERSIKISSQDNKLMFKNVFTSKNNNYPFLKDLQKLLSIRSYERTIDPSDHVQIVETLLCFRGACGPAKCKLFVLNLQKGAMAWFKNLKPHSISSWIKLCRKLKAHFTASRNHLKFVDNKGDIRRNPTEHLRDYIERFNKEVV
jgi:hypothetical protein